jgi:hypothetical protein
VIVVLRRIVGSLAAAVFIFVALFAARGIGASPHNAAHCVSHAHTGGGSGSTRGCADEGAGLHIAAAATFSSGPTVDVQAAVRSAAPFSRPATAGHLDARFFTARPHDPDHLHAYALLI